MPKSFFFSLIGIIVLIIGIGLFTLKGKKDEEVLLPAPTVAISASVEPTISATEEVEKPEEPSEGSKRTPHKLPEDIDEWTDEDWDQWTDAKLAFDDLYIETMEEFVGVTPTEEMIDVASDFAEESCRLVDNGYTWDELMADLQEKSSNENTFTALMVAMDVGRQTFCPWN